MKLELKHLAPYLPYAVHLMNEYGRWHNTTLNRSLSLFDMLEMKPILRPVSDLDILIETCFNHISHATKEEQFLIDLFCYENISTDECISDLDLTKLPYECVDYFFENHYDFFDLIPQGLAISIHDVE